MMDLKECIRKGLVIRDKKDLDAARKSLEVAEHKLHLAERAFEAKLFEDAIINCYACIFHAGRALMFRDGFRERSHFGLFVFLKERYSDKLEPRFLSELNALRLERHDLLYGLEISEVKEVEAEHVIGVAKDFLNAIKKLLK